MFHFFICGLLIWQVSLVPPPPQNILRYTELQAWKFLRKDLWNTFSVTVETVHPNSLKLVPKQVWLLYVVLYVTWLMKSPLIPKCPGHQDGLHVFNSMSTDSVPTLKAWHKKIWDYFIMEIITDQLSLVISTIPTLIHLSWRKGFLFTHMWNSLRLLLLLISLWEAHYDLLLLAVAFWQN